MLSARENVELALELAGREEDRQGSATAALAQVGLTGLEHRRRTSCPAASGGGGDRAGPGEAPGFIVIADEPTANLDSENGEQVLATMARLNRELGTTFLFSSAESHGDQPRPAGGDPARWQGDHGPAARGPRLMATPRLAARNLLRAPRRTVLTMVAIVAGVGVFIVGEGFLGSQPENVIVSAIEGTVGHVLARPNYPPRSASTQSTGC